LFYPWYFGSHIGFELTSYNYTVEYLSSRAQILTTYTVYHRISYYTRLVLKFEMNSEQILTLMSYLSSSDSDDDEFIYDIIQRPVIRPKISNFILNVVHS
jgi:hypothetical protein